jgi:hypothetical protein
MIFIYELIKIRFTVFLIFYIWILLQKLIVYVINKLKLIILYLINLCIKLHHSISTLFKYNFLYLNQVLYSQGYSQTYYYV